MTTDDDTPSTRPILCAVADWALGPILFIVIYTTDRGLFKIVALQTTVRYFYLGLVGFP